MKKSKISVSSPKKKREKKERKKTKNFYQLPMLSYPKNVNDYAHIIKKFDCQPSDVEFLLFLRTESKTFNTKSSKDFAPGYYEEDLLKYKKKNVKSEEEKKRMRTNFGTFENLFKDRSKIAVNTSQLMYETTLRLPKEPKKTSHSKAEDKKNDLLLNRSPWNSTQFHKGENLFETLLPPVLQFSKNNVEKIKNYIPHPYKKVNRLSPFPLHILEPNLTLFLRSPAEAGSPILYTETKRKKNFGAVRHLTEKNGNEFLKWASGLRGGKD